MVGNNEQIGVLKRCKEIYDNFSSRPDAHSIAECIRDTMVQTDGLLGADRFGPDAYCKYNGKIVMAEHFAVDASQQLEEHPAGKYYYKNSKGKSRGGSSKMREQEVNESNANVKCTIHFEETFRRFLERIEYETAKHYRKIDNYIDNLRNKLGVAFDAKNDICVFVVEFLDDNVKYNEKEPQLVVNRLLSEPTCTYRDGNILKSMDNCDWLIDVVGGKISAASILLTKDLKDVLSKYDRVDMFIFICGDTAFTVEPSTMKGNYSIKDIDTVISQHLSIVDRLAFEDIVDIRLEHVDRSKDTK